MILGVESSCDDTGLAVLDTSNGQFIYEKTSTQADLHALYGRGMERGSIFIIP
jgi:tRNA A37 threonylcarbamoyltransferase TsaD